MRNYSHANMDRLMRTHISAGIFEPPEYYASPYDDEGDDDEEIEIEEEWEE